MTKTTDPFDFAALDLGVAMDKPCEFEITHPHTLEGLGVFVSVVGEESDTFRAYTRAMVNSARVDAFRKQRSKGAAEPRRAEEDEKVINEAIAACMTGWRTVIDGKSEPVILIGGERLEFSQANAIRWIDKFRWARQQVNDATADLGNFITA